MTALWAAEGGALSLHPGDRLPCKVASLCMSASDGEVTKTKCYLPANSVCVCASSVLWSQLLIIPVSSKIWECCRIMMYQGIRQSDSTAKWNAFIWSGLDDERGVLSG